MVGHIGLGPGVTNGQFRIEVGTADTTLNERDGLVHSDVSFILKLRRMPANMILRFVIRFWESYRLVWIL